MVDDLGDYWGASSDKVDIRIVAVASAYRVYVNHVPSAQLSHLYKYSASSLYSTMGGGSEGVSSLGRGPVLKSYVISFESLKGTK